MKPRDNDIAIQRVVGPEEAGARLDRVVSAWRGLSRSAVLRLLDAGAVVVEGCVVSRKDKGRVLRAGEVLGVAAGYDGGEAPLADPAMPLVVLAEGAGWVVVDKPAGVAVRPHTLGETGTVLNAVAGRYPQVVGVGEGGLRSGVVHRLDNETSGALIIATEQSAWQRMRAAFAEHRVEKHYLALVQGQPADTGESVQHLRVARHNPAWVESHREPAPGLETRACSLAWRVVERFGSDAALIDVDLHTGFLHQVRVMMCHLGHPVIGDAVYGQGRATHGAPRQMLHARSIALDEVAVEAPLPGDVERVLAGLRVKASG